MSNGVAMPWKLSSFQIESGQPVEVVGRAERLGDLLVQAVAHVLRRGVERQEDRRARRASPGPTSAAARRARRRRKPCQSVSPGTMKQAAVGKTRAICAAGTASMRICAASGSSVSAMSMPGLGAQPGDQRVEVRPVGAEPGRARDRPAPAPRSAAGGRASRRSRARRSGRGSPAPGRGSSAPRRCGRITAREAHRGDLRPAGIGGAGGEADEGEAGEEAGRASAVAQRRYLTKGVASPIRS